MNEEILHELKLEISKNVKLNAYERLTFHKILGVAKSDTGMSVLLNEISKGGIICESAISALTNFPQEEVSNSLIKLLVDHSVSLKDADNILTNILNSKNSLYCDSLIDFIEAHLLEEEWGSLVSKAFVVLQVIGDKNESVYNYCLEKIMNHDNTSFVRANAIKCLSCVCKIDHYEELLKEKDEIIVSACYRSLVEICEKLTEIRNTQDRPDDDDLFTYSAIPEDKRILEIRVLIGKQTPHFNIYTRKMKVSFLNTMIACNHREMLIYLMKALTSDDSLLIDAVLQLILDNVFKIRDMEKILKHLIALPSLTHNDNDIIISIFEKYFLELPDNRKNNIIKDKVYNYIVVTLDSYFEIFRKEFLMLDLSQQNLPDDFIKLRNFIMDYMNPKLKKKIVNFLRTENNDLIIPLIREISEEVPYVEDHKQELKTLIEILNEKDEKIREIAANRIEGINFEKRYVRNRILRLCEIICRLKITDTATALVKILNYVKKYSDVIIYDKVCFTLSVLNYSYMLGEIEVMLFSGDQVDVPKGLDYIVMFNDQRALSILLELLHHSKNQQQEFVLKILNILLKMDIHHNLAVNQLLKEIINKGKAGTFNEKIEKMAVLNLGYCGLEDDLDYLNELFLETKYDSVKEAVIRSIIVIVSSKKEYDKRKLLKFLKSYQKEPAINVRIYAAVLLLQIEGNIALQNIKDMMVIKNKKIQREIMTVLSGSINLELVYFFMSLIQEDYAISSDILHVIKKLPQIDLKDVDQFVTNIFKKHDGIYGSNELLDNNTPVEKVDFSHIEEKEKTVLYLTDKSQQFNSKKNVSLDLMLARKKSLSEILKEVEQNNGIVNQAISGDIVCCFDDVNDAIACALNLHKKYLKVNQILRPKDRYKIRGLIFSDKFYFDNGELLIYPKNRIKYMLSANLRDVFLLDDYTHRKIEDLYQCDLMPDVVFRQEGSLHQFYVLNNVLNFYKKSLSILDEVRNEEEKKRKDELAIEEQLKLQKKVTPHSEDILNFSNALDEIGVLLKDELLEIQKYVNRRSTDREMNKNVQKMLQNVYKKYTIEAGKVIIK